VPCAGKRLLYGPLPEGADDRPLIPCPLLVPPGLKTGQCRHCWRTGLSADKAKLEPEEQGAMVERMLRAFMARAEGEDPGRGLAEALRLADLAGDLAESLGMKLSARYGTSHVGHELGLRRKTSDQRWGPKARSRKIGWDA
jgi:hypothetical protein